MSEKRGTALTRITDKVTDGLSSSTAMFVALGSIITWAISRSLWPNDDTWMLVINTVTTIITFVVGFVILYTTARESRAVHAKLDAIILSLDGVDDRLLGLEEEPGKVIKQAQRKLRGEEEA